MSDVILRLVEIPWWRT